MGVGGQGSGSKTIGVRRPVPALRDELGWHILCFGSVGHLKTCQSVLRNWGGKADECLVSKMQA